jgi:hypothetical protein
VNKGPFLKHLKVYYVWNESPWDMISCVFLKNSKRCREMVTRRLHSFSQSASHDDRAIIYRMKHLKQQDSIWFFFNKVLGSKNVCPRPFGDVAAEILKMCDRLKFAIITINSLSASKSSTQPTLEDMRGILNLRYIHLPLHIPPPWNVPRRSCHQKRWVG